MLIYPLLIGLIISVNVAGGVITARDEYRTTVLAGMALLALGAIGFATFAATTPKWEALIFMALIGLGVGPQLSGLQIAMMRSVTPQRIGGALGTLLLLRQVGAAVALAGGGDDLPPRRRPRDSDRHGHRRDRARRRGDRDRRAAVRAAGGDEVQCCLRWRRCMTQTTIAPTIRPRMAEARVLVSQPPTPPAEPSASCTSSSRWWTVS